MWLPRGHSGSSEGLDFAQANRFREAAAAPELVYERGGTIKREFLGTARLCSEAGFSFVPLIFEGHGGSWSPMARRVLDWIAGQAAGASGEAKGEIALRIAQRMSCTLQRENARTVLRRSTPVTPQTPHSGWAGRPDAWQ